MQNSRGHKNLENTIRRQPFEVYFDPGKSNAELFDELAEKQADAFAGTDRRNLVSSSQLRRFFGEIKNLYRRYDSLSSANPQDEEAIYHEKIEPMFKMVRSKVSYATRKGGNSKLPADFARLLSEGIGQVKTPRDFRRYVLHLEAVVGFMYGKDRVGK